MQNNRYKDWFRVANDDLSWGNDSLKTEHYSQSCYIAQQVAEKSLKALALFKGYDIIKTHSVRRLAEELKINGEILERAKILDQYYITARYPDALAEGIPSETFTKNQATEALNFATFIHNKIGKQLNDK